ncbi:DEAD/DEAH box helicase [Spiribacter halobius]|uniref:ATP-dependent RNA helicase RhlB n=1 Tax=Sediminicurvatus halobius TaxID=2182432 RepID=A0A2U2MXW2_9GAMM|nr:DEAD/DEAH box helicase [Spiribacter halobius]PWG61579.1 RNA helicase [Spiribacter halobius]UEX77148.1 DEAD/DEAH box helicase [Spiribacter halobius]
MEKDHLSDVRFDSLGLHESLLIGLQEAGFERCTPIQAETLPILLRKQDVAGQAQTGTGKSAAFLLACMHHLMTTPVEEGKTGPWAVVLAPTRELALQIHKDAERLGHFTGMRFACIYGGTGYESQRRTLEQGVDIMIGTPGRIIDFYKQRVFSLDNVEVCILDEADRMFDMGFIADIRYLLRRMPPPEKRINMLFSATLSERVRELAYEHMNDPKSVEIASESITADNVRQQLYHVENDDKIGLLLGVLRTHDTTRTLIFVNTKRDADKVTGYLLGNDIKAAVISGDIPQNKREQLLRDFQQGELPVLVATDVAARGLHIPDVSHVINYDLPQDAEDYVHRVGRTARAGAAGDAISFACESYVYSLPDIEKYIEQKIPSEMAPPDLIAEDIKPPKRLPRRGPAKGGGSRGRPGGRGNGGSGRRSRPQAS